MVSTSRESPSWIIRAKKSPALCAGVKGKRKKLKGYNDLARRNPWLLTQLVGSLQPRLAERIPMGP